MQRLMTIDDAAAHFRVTRRTIHEWIRRGLLEPSHSLGPRGRGQQWRFTETQIAACRAGFAKPFRPAVMKRNNGSAATVGQELQPVTDQDSR